MRVDHVWSETSDQTSYLHSGQRVVDSPVRSSALQVKVVDGTRFEGRQQHQATLAFEFGYKALCMKRAASGQQKDLETVPAHSSLPSTERRE
jgi:hypothetical protein